MGGSQLTPTVAVVELEAASDGAVGRAWRTSRGARIGVLAAAGMAAFYAVVVGGLSGSFRHLADQVRADWYLLAPIVAGFGVQVGLMAELRGRQRAHRAVTSAGAAGSGASTVGMVACCAHHVADLAPFLGATAAATFLYDRRVLFMLVGLGVNAVAIVVMARRLRRVGNVSTHLGEDACALE